MPNNRIDTFRANLKSYQPNLVAKGKLVRVTGMLLEAVGCQTNLGGVCRIEDGDNSAEAEVVGFESDRIFMMPVGNLGRFRPGATVVPLPDKMIGVGDAYLGRVIDGNGEPLDGRGPIEPDSFVPVTPPAINPLHRKPISEVLDTGIVAINSFMTVGRGQRLGLFAGSGVGKSVLLGMMTRYTEAEVIVVGLIGERGREVQEFIEQILDEKGLSRAIVVAAPADDSPTMKIRASFLATRLAEYYRDQGKQVLLLMDSLTRFAQAQRQISLAVGEPPSTKGYPPSVFAKVPELVERAGNGVDGGGSITAFYTVLAEGDDVQDPVADSARAILDGHITLSRSLAESGHYPAIDIEASVSRTMPNIVPKDHLSLAQRFRQVYSKYRHNEDLITVGAYSSGADADVDYAVEKFPQMQKFLQQGIHEGLRLKESLEKLQHIF
ncbi:MAG: flagellum-specific ATP synthase [Candidatus Azotimanducaceae bacterium]|jgi:flagellum-specific ATP synthase